MLNRTAPKTLNPKLPKIPTVVTYRISAGMATMAAALQGFGFNAVTGTALVAAALSSPLVVGALRRALRRYVLSINLHMVTDIWAGDGKHIRVPVEMLRYPTAAPLESTTFAALIHGPGIRLPSQQHNPTLAFIRITRVECVPESGWLQPALLRLLRLVTSGRVVGDAGQVEAALPRLGLAGSSRCPKYRRPHLDGLATLSHEHRTLRWMRALADARTYVVTTAARLVAMGSALGAIRDELQSRHSGEFVDLRITPIHDGDKRGAAIDVTWDSSFAVGVPVEPWDRSFTVGVPVEQGVPALATGIA